METIVSFHIQNISNSKAERNTVPLVGNTCMGVRRGNCKCACVWFREMDDYLYSEISFRKTDSCHSDPLQRNVLGHPKKS